MAIGESSEGERVRPILLDGLREHLARELDPGPVGVIKELPPAEIVVVRDDVPRRDPLDRAALPVGELDPERRDDAPRDFLLDGENVLELAVELTRPEMVPVRYVHQLARHPDPAADFSYAAFHHRLDTQFAADCPHVLAFPFERERRRPRGDPEPVDLGERVDDLLRHAVAEIVLILLGAEIDEGQNADRPLEDPVATRSPPPERIARPGDSRSASISDAVWYRSARSFAMASSITRAIPGGVSGLRSVTGTGSSLRSEYTTAGSYSPLEGELARQSSRRG